QIATVFVPLMNSASWKHDFAGKVLSTWQQGGSVLITDRVWSKAPRREWNWAEGDDPKIGWNDVADFFAPLDHQKLGTNEDGFEILTLSSGNEAALKSF